MMRCLGLMGLGADTLGKRAILLPRASFFLHIVLDATCASCPRLFAHSLLVSVLTLHTLFNSYIKRLATVSIDCRRPAAQRPVQVDVLARTGLCDYRVWKAGFGTQCDGIGVVQIVGSGMSGQSVDCLMRTLWGVPNS